MGTNFHEWGGMREWERIGGGGAGFVCEGGFWVDWGFGTGERGILVVEGGVREGLGGRVRAKDAKVRKGEC